ncbi:MAG: OmpA family protein [Sphingobacteriales bacterium]|nr:OmpA family protein [Sphingobacteriales bacterium]
MKKLLAISFLLFGSMAIAQNLEPKGKIKDPKKITEKVHNVLLSKRMTTATNQRDSLHLLTIAYHKDTTERGIQYRDLDSRFNELTNKFNNLEEKHKKLDQDYADMNQKYTDLIRSSLNKTEQLNLALKEKGEQLLERERKLAVLEALIKEQDSITNALNNVIKKALLSFKSDEISVEMKNGKVYVSMSDKLLFKSGSAEVEEKGLDALKKLAEVLNKNKDVGVMIEGHTDNIPIKTAQFKDNWDLSVARATNIVRMLDEVHQVDAKNLTAAGRGEYMPKASNETAEGRAKNRRTEIILSPKLDELYKLINKNK